MTPLEAGVKRYLKDLRARSGRKGLSRIEGFFDNLIGKTPRKPDDPRQRGGVSGPVWIPGLRAQPWHDPAEFPWLAELRKAYPVLLREMRTIYAARLFSRLEEERRDIEYAGWEAFDLQALDLYVGEGGARATRIRFRDNLARAPVAAALLERLPVVGDCFYSLLRPGGSVKPHFSHFNGKLICHLGLQVPPDCAIRVADETRAWKDREFLIFDDTFEHETWNRSRRPRALFHIGVWHPDLTAREIAAISGWFDFLAKSGRRPWRR